MASSGPLRLMTFLSFGMDSVAIPDERGLRTFRDAQQVATGV
jgi:hypothetical protein